MASAHVHVDTRTLWEHWHHSSMESILMLIWEQLHGM